MNRDTATGLINVLNVCLKRGAFDISEIGALAMLFRELQDEIASYETVRSNRATEEALDLAQIDTE